MCVSVDGGVVCVEGWGDYPCCYQRQAAIHSSWNERFSSVTKQFLCFHGAIIMSKSQRKQRGERKKKKKINVPHHQQQSQPSRQPPCKYTRQHIHSQTQGDRPKICPCDLNLFIWFFFFFFLTEISGHQESAPWVFLLTAGACLKTVMTLRGKNGEVFHLCVTLMQPAGPGQTDYIYRSCLWWVGRAEFNLFS